MQQKWKEHVVVDQDDLESLAQEFEREILPLARKVGLIARNVSAKQIVKSHHAKWAANFNRDFENQKAAALASLGTLAIYIAESQARAAADPVHRHRARDARTAGTLLIRMYGELRMLEHKDPPLSERQSRVAKLPRGPRKDKWPAERLRADRAAWISKHGKERGWLTAVCAASGLKGATVRRRLGE